MSEYADRWYDANTGRWFTRDPIQERGGLNLYGFLENDGVNERDYLGMLGDLGDPDGNTQKGEYICVCDIQVETGGECCKEPVKTAVYGSAKGLNRNKTWNNAHEQVMKEYMKFANKHNQAGSKCHVTKADQAYCDCVYILEIYDKNGKYIESFTIPVDMSVSSPWI